MREALHERKTFLHIAPYLSHPLPIMLPIYKYVDVVRSSLNPRLTPIAGGGKSPTSTLVRAPLYTTRTQLTTETQAARCTISSPGRPTWNPRTSSARARLSKRSPSSSPKVSVVL